MKHLKKITAALLLLTLTLTAFLHTPPQLIQAESNASIIGYELKTVKKEYKDKKGNVRGVVSFQYPKFLGDSSAVKKINKQLKKARKQFFDSNNAKNIKETTKDSIKNNRFHYDTDQYFWTSGSGMAYGKDNIVSFYVEENWYAGGVHNRYYYGLNYDLNTGKELTIDDVIEGDAKSEILKAAKKYCKDDAVAYEIVKNTKKYNFYFDPGKVYICYGSYELSHGTSCDVFEVKGKY